MNLANKITIIRILLVPFFLLFLLVDFPYHNYVSAFIFILAASTDKLDGYIAKKRNEVTNFGKFMDPLADKLLITAALVGLVEMGRVPSVIAIIILSREFIITGFRTLAVCDGVILAASRWGKIKTVFQMIAVVLILMENFPFQGLGIPFDQIALYLALLATIISGVNYIYKNCEVLYKSK